MCGLVKAYSETFEVKARSVETKSVNLNDGDHFFIQVTIIGNPLNFTFSDPDGKAIFDQTIAGGTDFQLTATKSGSYSLQFKNELSDETKFVTLNYNIQRYIFGLPQEYFMLFVIVGLAFVAVIVFVAMSPKP